MSVVRGAIRAMTENDTTPDPATDTRIIGYCRVSTTDGRHKTDLQRDALRKAGVTELFEDHCSGAQTSRPDLEARGVHLRSLGEQIDTSSATGCMTFQIMAALAAFERELRAERVAAGIAAYRTRTGQWGRKPTVTAEKLESAQLPPTTVPTSPGTRPSCGRSVTRTTTSCSQNMAVTSSTTFPSGSATVRTAPYGRSRGSETAVPPLTNAASTAVMSLIRRPSRVRVVGRDPAGYRSSTAPPGNSVA